MNTGPIEDHLAIRQLLETYTVGCMRADKDIWGGTWAEDASWKIDMLDAPASGRSEIIAVWEKIMGNIQFVTINSFPAELVFEGDRARGKAYTQELIFPKAGGQRTLVSCSTDEYVKREGRWYFLSRVFSTMWRSATG